MKIKKAPNIPCTKMPKQDGAATLHGGKKYDHVVKKMDDNYGSDLKNYGK